MHKYRALGMELIQFHKWYVGLVSLSDKPAPNVIDFLNTYLPQVPWDVVERRVVYPIKSTDKLTRKEVAYYLVKQGLSEWRVRQYTSCSANLVKKIQSGEVKMEDRRPYDPVLEKAWELWVEFKKNFPKEVFLDFKWVK